MGLRDWSTVNYLPILSLTPAEMKALQELPRRDRDHLLPFIPLRAWMSAATLEKALNRVAEAYGERPFIADLAAAGPDDEDQVRPVFAELRTLRNSANGYAAWCDFISDHRNLIPAIQLRDVAQLSAQVDRLYGLGRGLCVRLERPTLPVLEPILAAIADRTDQGRDLSVIVDLGRQTRNLLLEQAQSVAVTRRVQTAAPNAVVAISASSFPEDFRFIQNQDIYERQHFDGVVQQLGPDGLIYSDRGSARAERQMGGGGTPAPRIDYAGGERWDFFRSDPVSRDYRPAAYAAQAVRAMAADCWDPRLRVWGCQMIEATAREDEFAIWSTNASTATRINIHLHRQLFHDDPVGLYETDEDWED